VLYVVAEGAFGFKGRVYALKVGWHTETGNDRFHILPVPVNLMDRTERSNLYALVRWGGYDFVILHTMARCMVGADENSAKDCGVVIEAWRTCWRARPAGRGVVLAVHHAGKDGKTMRGSSAFESGVDTVYFTGRDGDLIDVDGRSATTGPKPTITR